MNLSALGSLNVQFAPNDAFNVKTFAEKVYLFVSLSFTSFGSLLA